MNRCAHCGKKKPYHFLVPDCVWEFYVKLQDRKKILCLTCYKTLVDWKDGGEFQHANGKIAGHSGDYPLPDGGYDELFSMSKEEQLGFVLYAYESGDWDWIKDFIKAHPWPAQEREWRRIFLSVDPQPDV
jgi:hypothetical protein